MKDKNPKRAVQAADAAAGVAARGFGIALKVIVTFILVFITSALLFACIFAFYVKTCLTDRLDVTLSDFSLSLSSAVLYQDEDGQWQELTTLSASATENRVWVDYEDIPKDMEHALVAIEDKRFYNHKGVDWYRTFGAFVNMFVTMRDDFGGSTITQQLLKNVTQKDDVTVQRKLLEIFQALELEKNYDKKDIIMWYLNAVYFGEGCYGVYTAAQTYFDKELSELTLAECASIVAITNNPSRYDPFISAANNKERQEIVLYEMYDQGYISYDEYLEAVEQELPLVLSEDEQYSQEIYSYYVETVINDVLEDLMERKGVNLETARHMLYSGGYRIYSCYKPDIQEKVDAVYQNVAALPQPYRGSGKQFQSAIVIMDPYTGDIVALSGGVGEKTRNFGLNRIDTQRPSGSSVKPLAAYGPAFDIGIITQNTLVNDAGPDEITLSGNPNWLPRNSGGGYRGIITIRQALISSINTVSAQIIDKLGVDTSFEYMTERLGFTTLVEADRDYAPLALGQFTNGVTVREMTQAYCSFVNEGVFTQSRTYQYVEDANGNKVMDNPQQTRVAWKANTAANILDILNAAATYGTGSEASFSGMTIAGKTGTSSNNWDRWFVGMTPYYVAGVWTGYDENEYMYVYGNPAAQIWKMVMEPIHEGLENKSFPRPVVGADTQIFGDLTEEEEEPEVSPSPSPTPDTGEAPATPVTTPETEVPSTGTDIVPLEPVV